MKIITSLTNPGLMALHPDEVVRVSIHGGDVDIDGLYRLVVVPTEDDDVRYVLEAVESDE